MNAALRAAVRIGIYLGCKVYLINDGFQGSYFILSYLTSNFSNQSYN